MKGIIVMWGGDIVDIPAGWHLCDGTDGTPDLRNKFIIGAGGVYDPEDTGGSTFHAHDWVPSPHSHGLVAGNVIPLITPNGQLSTNTNAVQADGSVSPTTTLPPFFALAYIIKL